MVHSSHRRLVPWLALAVFWCVAAAPRAHASPPGVWIDSPGPVARFGTSADLHCLAWRDEEREGVFFGDTGCGTLVATDEGLFVPDDIPGANSLDDVSSPYTPITQTRSGDGSAATPFTIATSVMAGTAIRVDQTDTHRSVASDVLTRITVTNVGDRPRTATVFRAADCYSGGDDEGWGDLGPGSATCISTGTPRVVRPWDTDNRPGVQAFEGESDDLWRRIAQHAPGGSPRALGGRCACTARVDNAVALAWTVRLDPGEAISLNVSTDVGAAVRPGAVGIHEAGLETTSRPYVALGDSYSSGEGAGDQGEDSGYDYMEDTARFGNQCHRSWNAYPVLVARTLGLDPANELAFRACSGATISNLTTAEGGAHGREGPQIEWIGAQTRLVTLTIGGNDAGFGDIVASCLSLANCRTDKDAAARAALERLGDPANPDGLQATFEAVRRRAPEGASVLVLGYPDFVPYRARCLGVNQFASHEKHWLSGNIRLFNSEIASRARAARVTFVSVNREYRDPRSPHRMCEPDEYVNGVRGVGPGGAAPESVHPNRLGQDAFRSHVLTSPGRGRIRAAQADDPAGAFPDDGRTLLVVAPDQPGDLPVHVPPSSDVWIAWDRGDAERPEVGLRDPAGRPVALRSQRADDTGSRPAAVVSESHDGGAIILYRQPPGDYRLTVRAGGDRPPVVMAVTVTAERHRNSPPAAIADGAFVGRYRVALTGASSLDAEDGDVGATATWRLPGATRRGARVTVAGPPARWTARLRVTDREGAGGTAVRVVDPTPTPYFRIKARRAGGRVRVTLRCLPSAVGQCMAEARAGAAALPMSAPRGGSWSGTLAASAPTMVRVRVQDEAIRPREGRWTRRV